MFTVRERDDLRAHVLRMAEDDERVVGGAVVGSLALGNGDAFSDLDLTFAVPDSVPVSTVLADWTEKLVRSFDAVQLVELTRGPTTYRVFLMPNTLQFDLSMTPASHFRPAGPRWRTLFGEVAPADTSPSPPQPGQIGVPTRLNPADLFGWGVIYSLHVRSCIERGRLWQAEHYSNALRDHALALACLREGVVAAQARGYDDLSPETLARLDKSHIGSLEPAALRAALAASLGALLREGAEAGFANASAVTQRLIELC